MGKVEPLLKTLQIRPSPPEALVQAYLVHVADLSDANFRKVLELKGIRGRDQSQLVEIYQMHKLSPRYQGSLVEKSPILTTLNIGASASTAPVGGIPSGGAAALQNLSALGNSAAASLSTANLPGNINIKFADGIGSALMDRFSSSTPALGGAGSPRDDAHSPPPSSANLPNFTITPAGAINGDADADGETGTKLNENLKNIGKFFKRDLGSFGAIGRFGGSKSASPGPEDRA